MIFPFPVLDRTFVQVNIKGYTPHGPSRGHSVPPVRVWGEAFILAVAGERAALAVHDPSSGVGRFSRWYPLSVKVDKLWSGEPDEQAIFGD